MAVAGLHTTQQKNGRRGGGEVGGGGWTRHCRGRGSSSLTACEEYSPMASCGGDFAQYTYIYIF